jgi:hypothetical protein
LTWEDLFQMIRKEVVVAYSEMDTRICLEGNRVKE